jgi:ribose 1,5-bisphosphate isomerase
MNKTTKFNKICKDIKSIKIQGARNIAKKAFYAYKLIPTEASKKKLISLRPTEPMLENVLRLADSISYKQLEEHFRKSQDLMNRQVLKIIRNNSVIFTHCHSSTVTKSLIYAKKHGKKFEIYNTETRPLFQGRKTANELRKSGIKVIMFTDSAMKIALTKDQDKEENTKPVDLILLGADAILNSGVINKVGSGLISDIAKQNKIPIFIIADAWKYSKHKIKLEQRPSKEVWNNIKIQIKNPAFEFIPRKSIKAIISEFGTLSYDRFLKKAGK